MAVTVVLTADVEEERVTALATAAAQNGGGRLIDVGRPWESGTQMPFEIEAALTAKAATVSTLCVLGDAISTAVGSFAQGANVQAVINVIDAGHPEAIIGLSESDWFEAKSQPWDMSSEHGKLELARDVASFANSRRGAIIVVGATTKKTDGQDRLVAVKGIPRERFSIQRARAVIDNRVYPTVAGLAIRVVNLKGSELAVAYVRVPAQDPALYPFLVHETAAGNGIDGTSVSIVRRHGEGTDHAGIAEVHALLAAGRRALRG